MPSGRLVLFDFKRCWVRVPSHAEPSSLYPWGLTVMNCGYDQSCMILAIFYILFGCLVCEPSKIWFKHDNVFQVQTSKLRCYCIWCMTANWEETIAGSTVLRMRTAWTGWNATAAKVCKLLVCHVCQFFLERTMWCKRCGNSTAQVLWGVALRAHPNRRANFVLNMTKLRILALKSKVREYLRDTLARCFRCFQFSKCLNCYDKWSKIKRFNTLDFWMFCFGSNARLNSSARRKVLKHQLK